jgi:esterase/lipase superfamily enzyme
MSSSELQILMNNSENLIVTFAGLNNFFQATGHQNRTQPFEFLNYLSKTVPENTDCIFFVDNHKPQCWYHKGFKDITKNIDESVIYLNKIIKRKPYKKIIFMGVSMGGYAAILFGAKCNVTNVIAFVPQTMLFNNKHQKKRYNNLKNIIYNCNDKFRKKTNFLLIGSASCGLKDGLHHISHCYNLQDFENVKINVYDQVDMKMLRDSGIIKGFLDEILLTNNENDSEK